MFSIGAIIRDPLGNEWFVTQTWIYNDFFCVALVGKDKMSGQMGGARFRTGDEILIRKY